MNTRLILYDITDNPLRTRMANLLLAWGFERLQYSVFGGMHTSSQWQKCRKAIDTLVKKHGDGTEKIMILLISAQSFREMDCIGPKPDLSEMLNEKITLWF